MLRIQFLLAQLIISLQFYSAQLWLRLLLRLIIFTLCATFSEGAHRIWNWDEWSCLLGTYGLQKWPSFWRPYRANGLATRGSELESGQLVHINSGFLIKRADFIGLWFLESRISGCVLQYRVCLPVPVCRNTTQNPSIGH